MTAALLLFDLAGNRQSLLFSKVMNENLKACFQIFIHNFGKSHFVRLTGVMR